MKERNKHDIKHFHRTDHVSWLRDACFFLKFWIDCLVSQNDMPLYLILWQCPKDKVRDAAFSCTTFKAEKKKKRHSMENTLCYCEYQLWPCEYQGENSNAGFHEDYRPTQHLQVTRWVPESTQWLHWPGNKVIFINAFNLLLWRFYL